MEFRIDTSTGMNIGIAVLPGRIDAANSPLLQQAFPEWLKKTSNLVFDCRQLDLLDSSGLGVIVSCLRKTIERQGDLKLAALSNRVAILFELTKAKRLFSIHPDTGAAIRAFSSENKE
ncbi:STAS domain-containing protein [Chlorobium sp. N1]|uniref:STAS domain-containing protein n=1 Tax=Chlorobium sp. N1 TaxID=2491138 RepID=UPI001038F984|nr:STAS domain-containing protein [Chlorobium sp. N1]TCD48542.1 anti-sigma factor antagonist [Chlorobium sp. N1]